MPWTPWFGSDYTKGTPERAGGVLLLGESGYSWESPKGSGIWHDPSPDHIPEIIADAIADPTDCSMTMQVLTAALARTEKPTSEQATAGWQRVAYTNYIPVGVGRNYTANPTSAMWRQAREEWPDLLNMLLPSVIVVFGKDTWSGMPQTDFVDPHGHPDYDQGYHLRTGRAAVCHAYTHAGRSHWRFWELVLDKATKEAAVYQGLPQTVEQAVLEHRPL